MFGIFFLLYIKDIIKFDISKLSTVIGKLSVSYIVLGIIFYNFAHLLRTFRLYFLMNDSNIGFINLLKLQYKANAVNLILPFKLGESYRIYAFSKPLGNITKSLITLFIERSLDLFVIFFILTIVYTFNTDINSNYTFILYFILTVSLIIIITIYSILPQTLQLIQKRILEKGNIQFKTVSFFITKLLESITILTELINNKISSLSIISLLIWIFEIATLITFFNIFNTDFKIYTVLSIYIALSSLLPNGPAGLGGIQLAFYYVLLNTEYGSMSTDYAYIYSIFIFGSAIIFGLFIYLSDYLHKNESK